MTQIPHSWQREVSLPVGLYDPRNDVAVRAVTLRKMTGNEEALLADSRLRGNGGKLISALLASCVTALGESAEVDGLVRKLPSADRNYLLLELRRLTFGDEMEAHYRCPRCQATTLTLEDLSTIEVRRLEEDPAAPEIRITLEDGYRDPDGNWQTELVFGLPTGEDEEAAGSRRDANPTRQRDALLARCLKQVGDMEPRRIRGIGPKILASLSMSDRRRIQKGLDDAAPGPDLTRCVVCEQCGEEYRTSLDMSDFFPLG